MFNVKLKWLSDIRSALLFACLEEMADDKVGKMMKFHIVVFPCASPGACRRMSGPVAVETMLLPTYIIQMTDKGRFRL